MSEYVVYSGCASAASSRRDAHGDAAPRRGAAPSPTQTASRNITGTSSAVSFSQYWKACTKVMLRIPPKKR